MQDPYHPLALARAQDESLRPHPVTDLPPQPPGISPLTWAQAQQQEQRQRGHGQDGGPRGGGGHGCTQRAGGKRAHREPLRRRTRRGREGPAGGSSQHPCLGGTRRAGAEPTGRGPRGRAERGSELPKPGMLALLGHRGPPGAGRRVTGGDKRGSGRPEGLEAPGEKRPSGPGKRWGWTARCQIGSRRLSPAPLPAGPLPRCSQSSPSSAARPSWRRALLLPWIITWPLEFPCFQG